MYLPWSPLPSRVYLWLQSGHVRGKISATIVRCHLVTDSSSTSPKILTQPFLEQKLTKYSYQFSPYTHMALLTTENQADLCACLSSKLGSSHIPPATKRLLGALLVASPSSVNSRINHEFLHGFENKASSEVINISSSGDWLSKLIRQRPEG
ncbi:hypothetical protein BDV59DRAFT_100068 [Aspergillus ambiguus]|uniref:uncharacterized protein n=1 Tax=Aspergillus ambiguus TaxID=176160 RepID=UPI003CCD01FD